ncbi:putative aldo/keto reductase-like oxidoreductase [Caldicoprobacter guelmensis]|uniref:aldo/keto reductase n=1 Tax=Caldicoprobacter guelmensis TaxID=1170224 RepID=UPI001957C215|nr:aldo/keto reductase [Caldicoprobacter guelmensis]MBM7583167.1 putative aldo/keto reductase-like oxidoreductase [Caldicoprobacter guelmensis]
MYYREFGNLGFKVSTFGMGCMRLPLQTQPDGSKDYSAIDEDEAIKMIRYAIDNGVNYIDTAYPYHGGNSEIVVGKALKDGYRERVKLATKLPMWKVESYEDCEKLLDEQLSKLQVDYIDFYLLHALDKERWEKVEKFNILKFLDKAVESGKIKYPGFSFHDQLPIFKVIIDAYDWKMCQIQLNFLDENYQAGVEGMRYAASKGIPVVIMEPLKGGRLAHNIPKDIQQIWDSFSIKRSPVEWAFRWLYNFPEVTVILSGVSTMEQLKENIEIFKNAAPNSMTQEELELIAKVKAAYESKIKVSCTSCNYCMPCPSGINIPRIFSLYNNASMYDDIEGQSREYKKLIEEKADASKCVECGQCESACPQGIPIIEKLKEAHDVLTQIS